jgi:signal transduction histidine kinase
MGDRTTTGATPGRPAVTCAPSDAALRPNRGTTTVLLASVLAVLLALQLYAPVIVEPPRHTLFDLLQRFSPPAAIGGTGVAVIAIDDDSISRIGQWPWPRDTLARLVEQSGAGVIGIAAVLAEPDRVRSPSVPRQSGTEATPNDDYLAATIARRPVVLASATGRGSDAGGRPIEMPRSLLRDAAAAVERFLPSHPRIVQPLTVLTQAAAGTGVAGVTLSRDGMARRLVGIARSNDVLLPGFALEMLRVAVEQPNLMIQGSDAGPEAIRIGQRLVPIDVSGHLWVRYTRPEQIAIIPAWTVLTGTHDRTRLAGRLAIIGTTAVGLGDSIPTPIGKPLSAAEIQAHAIASILGGHALSRPANLRVVEVVATLLAGLAVIAVARRRASLPLAALPLLLVPLAAAAWVGFAQGGMLLDTAFAMVATLVLTAVALGERMLSDARALRLRERELEAALIKAAAADRAKSEFLANTSHELRTPLTAIIGFSEMMELQVMGAVQPAPYGRYVSHIGDSARHLLALVDDLLDMSLVDLGQLRLREETVNPVPTIRSCQTMVGQRAAARHVEIAFAAVPPLPHLRADPKMLRQMLLNLLDNAIKFSPPHASIDVIVRMIDGSVVVSIRDRGPGMDPAQIPRALERFGKLSAPSVANPQGIGIGLPLTRAMIELHGGRLEIVSRRDEGTETRLWFPPDRCVAPSDESVEKRKAIS